MIKYTTQNVPEVVDAPHEVTVDKSQQVFVKIEANDLEILHS